MGSWSENGIAVANCGAASELKGESEKHGSPTFQSAQEKECETLGRYELMPYQSI